MKTTRPHDYHEQKSVIPEERYLLPEWPAPLNVKAFTTLRACTVAPGYGSGRFSSFNLADHLEDDPANVVKNRQLLMKDWRFSIPPVWLRQVHGSTVLSAKDAADLKTPQADGCWTDRWQTPCAVMTADCLPVLFCDREGTRVAAIHAGWRGLAKGILQNTLQTLGVRPENLMVWLGPAISQKHFEVGPEVKTRFTENSPKLESAFIPGKRDRWNADLYQIARLQLSQMGVQSVYGGNHCTFDEKTRFYSHRRDGVTGRMATVIWLQKP